MNFTVITNYSNLTYEHYLKHPKHMVEWNLNENLAENPEKIGVFNSKICYPLIRKYSHFDRGENQDLEYFICSRLI